MRPLLAIVALFFGLTAASQAASLKIYNQTNWQIDNVYISPSYSDHFNGYDYLGATEAIVPGGVRMVEWVARDICYWDFRVHFHARAAYATIYRQNVCNYRDPAWTITPSDID